MKRIFLLYISLLADGGKQRKGGKRSSVKCTSARTFSVSERESRGICPACTGQKKSSCGCCKYYRYPWIFGSSASSYLSFASSGDSSLSLAVILHPYGGCKGVPKARQSWGWEEGRSWTLVLPFPTVPATESFPSSWKMLIFTEDVIKKKKKKWCRRCFLKSSLFPVSADESSVIPCLSSILQGNYSLHKDRWNKKRI